MFFTEDPQKAEKQQRMRAVLALFPPEDRQTVAIVARGLKGEEHTYYDTFLEWARPFGRLKARQIWSNSKPDPDTFNDLLEARSEAASRQARFRPRAAGELETSPPQQFRIKGVFPAEGVVAVYGPSGSAKSFLLIAAAAAISEGERFFGYPTRQGSVLYVALEGESGYRVRRA